MAVIKQKCLRAPIDLLRELEFIARGQGITLNGLILNILWQYIKDNKLPERLA